MANQVKREPILPPRILFAILPIVFILGCGSGQEGANSESGTGGDFSAPIPRALVNLTGGTLTAEVIVDGTGSPHPLTVQNNQVTGTISGLSLGSHTFTINYYINDVIVATGTASGTVTAGPPTQVTIASISYPDTDGDGFTNLGELAIFGATSTAWNDPSVRPPSETTRSSAKYIVADSVGVSSFIGESTSTNYTVAGIPSLLESASSSGANYTITPGP